MKLRGCIGNKITKNKNGENLPHLEITDLVLIHCNIISNERLILLTRFKSLIYVCSK